MRLQQLSCAAGFAALFLAGSARAQGLASFGPLDPNNGFPTNYVDDNGLSLDLCHLNSGLCILDAPVTLTNPNQPFPQNYGGTFPEESFWFICEADMPTGGGGSAFLRLAIEQAFANGPVVAGDQVSFARVRIRIDDLVPGATYNVTTPVGVFSLVAQNAGQRGINFTTDVGLIPGDFSGALNGAIGPFLTWDTDLPVVDGTGRQYIGNPNILHTITGSATGQNRFRVQGQAVGGQGVNSIETNLFAVAGLKSQAAPPPPGAPVAAFASAPNSGTAPLNVSFTDQSTGTITSRLWNFGDGSTSTQTNPNHIYAQGTFTVSLTVTGPGGTDTETKPNLIVVGNQPPGNQLVLANPTPGTAGVENVLLVTGATPGRVIGVYTGLQLGASSVNLGNCGGIPIGVARPNRLAGKAVANAQGVATIRATPPATSAGKTFRFQAVEPNSCRVSNIVSDQL